MKLPYWARIALSDVAILFYIVIGWSVPILKGGSFAPLVNEANLANLVVLVLVWLGIYIAKASATGNLEPPMPIAALQTQLAALQAAVGDLQNITDIQSKRLPPVPNSSTDPEIPTSTAAAQPFPEKSVA